ncbi:MAG: 1-acyl-sn-glycerol-3-phosphate acyltransferase [Treponema sp.]|jgi:glycerol-3-phosphate O-acyltransferase|nr:1-acyl-sn-glycerol-3-phosphate acyltransferase [Treponema sp.]
METLTTKFGAEIKKVVSLSKVPTRVTEDNVFQEADLAILPILDKMVEDVSLPGSGLDGLENIEELFAKAESGKSCMLLVEHYSNLDLSILSTMLSKAGNRGHEIRKSIIAISGIKLNEDNPVVAAFTGAYSKIVIYPSRSTQGLDPEKDKDEIARSNTINRAAMKALIRHKYKGHLVLVFPSGTRYRPWDPDTKKGLREIDSYIRSFDYMCFVALNGEVLQVQKTDMMNDFVTKDIIRVTVGPVVDCNEFRNKILDASAEDADKKQEVADAIMIELEKMHIAAEEKRKVLLKS